MALIRKVRQHENSRMWAYIESSDENKDHLILLGGKEFATKEEAVDFSKGFEPDSYAWVEPNELKIKRLIASKNKLIAELEEIDKQLWEAHPANDVDIRRKHGLIIPFDGLRHVLIEDAFSRAKSAANMNEKDRAKFLEAYEEWLPEFCATHFRAI